MRIVDLTHYRLTGERIEWTGPRFYPFAYMSTEFIDMSGAVGPLSKADADRFLSAAFMDTYFRRNRDPSDIDYVEDF